MDLQPIQTFSNEDRYYDGLSHGILVVEESRLAAKVEDPIRVLIGDDGEEGDDYTVKTILPLRDEPSVPPRVAVYFSEGS